MKRRLFAQSRGSEFDARVAEDRLFRGPSEYIGRISAVKRGLKNDKGEVTPGQLQFQRSLHAQLERGSEVA